MKIHTSDYLLMRFCARSQSLLRHMGNWETRLLGPELAAISIDRPIFITGLARSGTTLLLELLATVEGMATHRYRDFPFLMIPYFWNRFLDRFAVDQEPVERAHQDRIYVTRENPEAMEEPLWHAFFPHVHSATALHRLTAADAHAGFEQFYKAHIRKLLLLRAGSRYLAKGNYHVPRIEYLVDLFPDAHFIVPIRHPLMHIHSLVRQHQLFCSYAQADRRIPRYLQAMGHFEFGPQRIPIRLNAHQGDRTLDAWSLGAEYVGYSIQWKEIYGFVETLRKTNAALAQRIVVVRYEDLCARPESTLRSILQSVDVPPHKAGRVLMQLEKISKSQHAPQLDERLRRVIDAEVSDVAAAYHYRLDDA